MQTPSVGKQICRQIKILQLTKCVCEYRRIFLINFCFKILEHQKVVSLIPGPPPMMMMMKILIWAQR